MAVIRNIGKLDRAVRIVAGALMALIAVFVRGHWVVALFLGLSGLVILVEGAVGF